MGKSKHKDRAYITRTEYNEHFGGKKDEIGSRIGYRSLPFKCCALTFQPFTDPYATTDGFVFELSAILNFLKKFKSHPVNGKPLNVKQLFKLNIAKNERGEYHCPVTFKVFNDHTHIVAIRTTGNVYDYTAVKQFNLKLGIFNDLMTNEPFTKNDIITLQDPLHKEHRNYEAFDHVKRRLASDSAAGTDAGSGNINASLSMRTVFDEMKQKGVYKATVRLDGEKTPAQGHIVAPVDAESSGSGSDAKKRFTTHHAAASFTSTSFAPVTKQTAVAEPIDPRVKNMPIMPNQVKGKGYVTLNTNMGALNLELYCSEIPLACESFITHCSRGYYNNTVFHRSIKNFMLQGGDPTGSGRGGESIWGRPFRDECRPNLTHTGGGVLSMANSGTNTNGSQFFITYKSAPHLDGKHTVFGKVIGEQSMEVLRAMERVGTDEKDRPTQAIRILNTPVLTNPYVVAEGPSESSVPSTVSTSASVMDSGDGDGGVGRYLKKKRETSDDSQRSTDADASKSTSKKKAKTTVKSKPKPGGGGRGNGGFGDFSSW